jgi:hypothetical protein
MRDIEAILPEVLALPPARDCRATLWGGSHKHREKESLGILLQFRIHLYKRLSGKRFHVVLTGNVHECSLE